MHPRIRAVVGLTAAAVTVAATLAQPPQPAAAGADRAAATAAAAPAAVQTSTPARAQPAVAPPAVQRYFAGTPIKHVVVMYQENLSFDSLYASICRHRPTGCDGHVGRVKLRNGKTVRNKVLPDVVPPVAHTPVAQRLALRNKWNRLGGCHAPKYDCIGHYRRGDQPNMTKLATRFPVSDRTFSYDDDASFGAHVTLAAGTPHGFTGKNPKKGDADRAGWGCPSRRLVQWIAPDSDEIELVPSCVPGRNNRLQRETPVKYAPTVMEQMEQGGYDWQIYQGNKVDKPRNQIWQLCTYFKWCLRNRFTTKHNAGLDVFERQARRNRLPELSLMIPTAPVSQHNKASLLRGDNYIGRVLDTVMRSRSWRSTAVFITYDDCGCFYDHVKPPRGLGVRLPSVVVSPYAKAKYTDSRDAVMPYSILAFIAHNFGLPPLNKNTRGVYDYRFSFNFNRDPRRPINLPGRNKVPLESLRVLKTMSPITGET